MRAPQASPTMPRKGYSYVRFSGRRQEAGDSYRRQDALAEEAARQEGVELDRTLTLADKGVSAFRGRNWKKGDLGKFLDLVDEGVVPAGSVLIIEQVNRLSRMPWMEQVELWRELLQRGITIRTCTPPSRYTRENMNELAIGCPVVLFMMLGHQESQQKSEWVREAWGEKRRKAQFERTPHGKDCPAWIEAVTVPHPKDPARTVTTGYRLHEARAAVVRTIFRLAREGWGAFRIRKWLEETRTPALGTSGRWALSYVKKILRGREALGEYQPGKRDDERRRVRAGEPIPGYYPAVVSAEEFLAAQAATRARHNKGGRSGHWEANLFTHLVFEAGTSDAMHCHPRTSAGRSYKYLTTRTQRHTVPYPEFEQAILDAIADLKAKDVDGRHEADALTAAVDSLQQERARLDLEIKALDEQIRQLPPERWPQRVVARIAELEALLAQKDLDLQRAKEAANTSGRTEVLADLKTCVQLLDEVNGTPEEALVRRRIKTRLPLIVESIWVRVQSPHKRARILHVWICLRGGRVCYLTVRCGYAQQIKADKLEHWNYRGAPRGM